MNPDKKNWPAFPEVCNGQINPGMSLRDWFAGMALQGLYANDADNYRFDGVAKAAYLTADAMLKAREVNE